MYWSSAPLLSRRSWPGLSPTSAAPQLHSSIKNMAEHVADMVNLTTLDEASMMENLKSRFDGAPGWPP